MSLNGVQLFTQQTLDGLVSSNLPAAQAWVLPPPVVQLAENPQIFIWGAELDESRATLPRLRGEKRIAHMLSIWVQWVSDNDPAHVQDFPILLDSIRTALRTVPLPASITDPTTGEVTYLMDIGERILCSYGTPKTMADQRNLLFTASFKVHAAEHLSNA